MDLLDFIFPRHSLEGKEGELMTHREHMLLASAPRMYSTTDLRKRDVHSLDQLFAASTYAHSPLLRSAITQCKYHRIPKLAQELSDLLVQEISRAFPLRPHSCVCPVPLHWTRRYWRGFNQSAILAQAIATQYSIPLQNLLKRNKPTGNQTLRTHDDRRSALMHAFTATKRNRVDDIETIYLIDDVCTSGATMDACALALKNSGAQRVEGIVLAYG